MAMSRPRRPARKALIMEPPPRAEIKVTPRTMSINISGEPKESTSGRTNGMAAARKKAPITAPARELKSAAPRARPASPFLAMGCPSRMVAAAVPSPGTPKSTDVMSPVVATTACIPRRKAKAVIGSMV